MCRIDERSINGGIPFENGAIFVDENTLVESGVG